MLGGGEGRWEAVAVSVYAMPKINICGSGIILQQHLLFSPSFPFALFLKSELSPLVCVLNERKLCAASPQSDYFSNPGCQGRVRLLSKLTKSNMQNVKTKNGVFHTAVAKPVWKI